MKRKIRKEILSRIGKVKNRTQITFSEIGYIASEKGEYGLVGILCGSDPLIKKYESAHTKNITEAHEKGHIIRRYELDSQFSKKVKVYSISKIFSYQKKYLKELHAIFKQTILQL